MDRSLQLAYEQFKAKYKYKHRLANTHATFHRTKYKFFLMT